MRKILASVVAAALTIATLVSPASAAEAVFDPASTTLSYDVNDTGILKVWGVPAASGNPLVANPDYGYPAEIAIATWVALLLKAQELGKVVKIGYDPTTLEIWYVSKPYTP
jgi:hypothetical protein